jgi:hypothetical protein
VRKHLGSQDSYNLAMDIDSESRLLVLKAVPNNMGILFVSVQRYMPDGQIDGSFATVIIDIDESLADSKYSLKVDKDNGIFVGYSNLVCDPPNMNCQQDVFVNHYSSTGTFSGFATIAFDNGNISLRQNDRFADMIYIEDRDILAVAATVDFNSVFDTDFGVALLDVDAAGGLSLRTSFSTDGKQTCAFDQDIGNPGIGIDKAQSIVLEFGNPVEVIVGGSAFEGNGSNADGWNLAFCKLDILGDVVQQWSTIDNPDTLVDIEILEDMYYSSIRVQRLIVAAKFSLGDDNDFSIGQYVISGINWEFDSSFGVNGWGSVGFNQVFIGNTNDEIQSIVVEENEDILAAGLMRWQDYGVDHNNVALARFDKFGNLRTNWANSGQIAYDFSGDNINQLTDMVIDHSKKELYLVGQYPTITVKDSYVVNLLDNLDIIFLNGLEE